MRKVVSEFSCGQSGLRLCPVQSKQVTCHGLCKVVCAHDSGSGESQVHICPVFEKAFDKAVNCC